MQNDDQNKNRSNLARAAYAPAARVKSAPLRKPSVQEPVKKTPAAGAAGSSSRTGGERPSTSATQGSAKQGGEAGSTRPATANVSSRKTSAHGTNGKRLADPKASPGLVRPATADVSSNKAAGEDVTRTEIDADGPLPCSPSSGKVGDMFQVLQTISQLQEESDARLAEYDQLKTALSKTQLERDKLQAQNAELSKRNGAQEAELCRYKFELDTLRQEVKDGRIRSWLNGASGKSTILAAQQAAQCPVPPLLEEGAASDQGNAEEEPEAERLASLEPAARAPPVETASVGLQTEPEKRDAVGFAAGTDNQMLERACLALRSELEEAREQLRVATEAKPPPTVQASLARPSNQERADIETDTEAKKMLLQEENELVKSNEVLQKQRAQVASEVVRLEAKVAGLKEVASRLQVEVWQTEAKTAALTTIGAAADTVLRPPGSLVDGFRSAEMCGEEARAAAPALQPVVEQLRAVVAQMRAEAEEREDQLDAQRVRMTAMQGELDKQAVLLEERTRQVAVSEQLLHHGTATSAVAAEQLKAAQTEVEDLRLVKAALRSKLTEAEEGETAQRAVMEAELVEAGTVAAALRAEVQRAAAEGTRIELAREAEAQQSAAAHRQALAAVEQQLAAAAGQLEEARAQSHTQSGELEGLRVQLQEHARAFTLETHKHGQAQAEVMEQLRAAEACAAAREADLLKKVAEAEAHAATSAEAVNALRSELDSAEAAAKWLQGDAGKRGARWWGRGDVCAGRCWEERGDGGAGAERCWGEKRGREDGGAGAESAQECWEEGPRREMLGEAEVAGRRCWGRGEGGGGGGAVCAGEMLGRGAREVLSTRKEVEGLKAALEDQGKDAGDAASRDGYLRKSLLSRRSTQQLPERRLRGTWPRLLRYSKWQRQVAEGEARLLRYSKWQRVRPGSALQQVAEGEEARLCAPASGGRLRPALRYSKWQRVMPGYALQQVAEELEAAKTQLTSELEDAVLERGVMEGECAATAASMIAAEMWEEELQQHLRDAEERSRLAAAQAEQSAGAQAAAEEMVDGLREELLALRTRLRDREGSCAILEGQVREAEASLKAARADHDKAHAAAEQRLQEIQAEAVAAVERASKEHDQAELERKKVAQDLESLRMENQVATLELRQHCIESSGKSLEPCSVEYAMARGILRFKWSRMCTVSVLIGTQDLDSVQHFRCFASKFDEPAWFLGECLDHTTCSFPKLELELRTAEEARQALQKELESSQQAATSARDAVQQASATHAQKVAEAAELAAQLRADMQKAERGRRRVLSRELEAASQAEGSAAEAAAELRKKLATNEEMLAQLQPSELAREAGKKAEESRLLEAQKRDIEETATFRQEQIGGSLRAGSCRVATTSKARTNGSRYGAVDQWPAPRSAASDEASGLVCGSRPKRSSLF
ncbi:hypothetical protein CYMTET_27076 [Cymbomonas tetramitiformis]|uniref:Uncharacterized protein n=1 Tax=Cymbomonas tetramitiformis TaxID=36881 RepID=A0AAE0FR67_9CHLO|nr:hypothetical protein CYMTET_27076 [Cymbomonas tetramitiformis]